METTFWDQCYADGKTGWDRGDVHPALTNWIKQKTVLPERIIVPGCGRGHEVLTLVAHGIDVTAIDFADEPVQHLRSQLESVESNSEVIQQDIFDYQPNERVDAVYEQTCLCAISPEKRVQYEQAVFRWLKEGGELFVLFAQTKNTGENPPFLCGLDEMKKIFPESRWNWPDGELARYDHPSMELFELAASLTRRGSKLP